MSDKEFTQRERNAWFSGVPAGLHMERHLDVTNRLAYATAMSQDEAASLMNQVAAQGKLTGAPVNRLLASAIPIYNWIARLMKVTDVGAATAMHRGEITYTRFVTALDTFLNPAPKGDEPPKVEPRAVNVEPELEGHETAQSRADIAHRFTFHPAVDDEKVAAHGSVRESCGKLARKLDQTLPPGREKALAMTHLEDAMMWANAALARAK